MNKFMNESIKEAFEAVKNNQGGPFGAVIVKDNKIISRGRNMVVKTNDPTAHAEIVAIRKACKKLGKFDLSDCELYTSSEPCPMCFSTACWARIKKVYYGCTRKDAEKIGFIDDFIARIFKNADKPPFEVSQIEREGCLEPFKKWDEKKDKVQY